MADCPSWCTAPHLGDPAHHWRSIATLGDVHVNVIRADPGPSKVAVMDMRHDAQTLFFDVEDALTFVGILSVRNDTEFGLAIADAARLIGGEPQ
jgi:hypothetical protein